MLLCVFMVWPTKFSKYFEFCAKLICCLKICGECKKFCFREFGIKILVFENHIISYSCIIVLKFQCFELTLNVLFKKKKKKNCVFPQIWWASAHFDRSSLFFNRSKFFKYVCESLYLFRSIKTDFRSIELVSNFLNRVSVCFDRSRLFFDRSKLVKHVF